MAVLSMEVMDDVKLGTWDIASDAEADSIGSLCLWKLLPAALSLPPLAKYQLLRLPIGVEEEVCCGYW